MEANPGVTALNRQVCLMRARFVPILAFGLPVAAAIATASVLVLREALVDLRAEHRITNYLKVGFFAWASITFGVVAMGLVWRIVAAKPRLVPYFRRPSASKATRSSFNRGFGIAANLGELDALAGALGVTPLSTF